MSLADKIGNSFATVVEMLQDRKAIDDADVEALTGLKRRELEAFTNRNTPIFNIDVGTKVRIIYYLGKFQKNDFKPFVDPEKDPKFDLYLVVMAEKLTTNHMKEIAKLEKEQPGMTVQFFDLKEVSFNITKHVLVPKHEVIDDETEIAEIVKTYQVKTKHQFPLILRTDPVAKYYGMKPGNLVRITRVSPSAGEYFLYRCCV